MAVEGGLEKNRENSGKVSLFPFFFNRKLEKIGLDSNWFHFDPSYGKDIRSSAVFRCQFVQSNDILHARLYRVYGKAGFKGGREGGCFARKLGKILLFG